jgi:hypothetical protein
MTKIKVLKAIRKDPKFPEKPKKRCCPGIAASKSGKQRSSRVDYGSRSDLGSISPAATSTVIKRARDIDMSRSCRTPMVKMSIGRTTNQNTEGGDASFKRPTGKPAAAHASRPPRYQSTFLYRSATTRSARS